jgi:hypothetical protein
MPQQQDSLQYIQETGDRRNTRIAWNTHLSWKVPTEVTVLSENSSNKVGLFMKFSTFKTTKWFKAMKKENIYIYVQYIDASRRTWQLTRRTQLTLCGRNTLEKLTHSQVIKTFNVFHENWKFFPGSQPHDHIPCPQTVQ